jgi:hypothetical protein
VICAVEDLHRGSRHRRRTAVISLVRCRQAVGIILSGSSVPACWLISAARPASKSLVPAPSCRNHQLEDEARNRPKGLLQDRLQRPHLVVLAGETAIQDRYDLAPRAILRAGGSVECVGVPVDPGNLLMLAYLGEIPILGAPGCARSLKTNAIDWVLPRLLAGERLGFDDLAEMGHGGLLEDTGKRPMPRNRLT